MVSNSDHSSNDAIAGRGDKRRSEIQQIKQVPLIHLLERRGFKAGSRKLSSAVFPSLPHIDSPVSVFYASRNKAWLAKYKDPEGRTVTRTILDLWQIIYQIDYVQAVGELRQIAGLGTGSRNDPAGEQGPTTSAPADTGGDETPSPKQIDPRGASLQDAGAGQVFSGQDEKMSRMKARYDLLVERTKDFDPAGNPDKLRKAKQAVGVMDSAMRAGNERFFEAMATAVERLVGVGQ